MEKRVRIGIDLGGTKIEGLALDGAGYGDCAPEGSDTEAGLRRHGEGNRRGGELPGTQGEEHCGGSMRRRRLAWGFRERWVQVAGAAARAGEECEFDLAEWAAAGAGPGGGAGDGR